MTDTMPEADGRRTPWHLWVVGVVSLLWNAMGAADYVLTQMRFEPYMSGFSEAQLAFFYGFPTWAVVNWALGVWSAVAGSILLLVRLKWAFWAFLVSLAALIVGTIYWYGFTDAYAVTGMGAAIFNGVLVIVALLLAVYARMMAKAGVLR
ncbi:hypothetical protein [Henriciella aquimarina]|uniref:hypothetical protein n=1 Tax=Henriciella aquimarina TaxID=545261 RepID=UPI001F18C611|nr:hypothetical protein [Henriciella aquimarina]